MWFCDMPAPAPPPRLTVRPADVHAGVPDAAVTEVLAPAEAAEVAALVAEALALAAPDGELAETAVDVDDAAHPAASTLTASGITASSAFFTRLPSGRGQTSCHSGLPLTPMTPQRPPWLGLAGNYSGSRISA
jgi:hypothetical protein